jgi:vesicle coat complex subunit
MNKREIKLRDAIFSLHTRKFGNVTEKLVEIVRMEHGDIVAKAEDGSYDRDINGEENEIKGSKVLISTPLNLNKGNIVETILSSHNDNRHISFNDSFKIKWVCNIQQIKSEYFKTLWYVLFFEDCVSIFKITPSQIKDDEKVRYSDKQHRGNKGEGQFHVNNVNLKHHLENYLIETITYEDVYNKFNKK